MTVAHKGDNGEEEESIALQLCEWHAAEAIKRRLVHAGKYTKETREGLVDLINGWIKAPLNQVEEARKKLLNELHKKEREYLTSYYQPKEPLFLRAWTRQLPNLGVYST